MPKYSIVIDSCYEDIDYAVDKVLEFINRQSAMGGRRFLFSINLTLRELLNNAVEHGNRFNTDKKITCEVCLTDSIIEIKVADEGEGFTLDGIGDEDYPADLADTRHRGLKIIKKMGFELCACKNAITAKVDCIKLWNKEE